MRNGVVVNIGPPLANRWFTCDSDSITDARRLNFGQGPHGRVSHAYFLGKRRFALLPTS